VLCRWSIFHPVSTVISHISGGTSKTFCTVLFVIVAVDKIDVNHVAGQYLISVCMTDRFCTSYAHNAEHGPSGITGIGSGMTEIVGPFNHVARSPL
jgi:hypothetical protein